MRSGQKGIKIIALLVLPPAAVNIMLQTLFICSSVLLFHVRFDRLILLATLLCWRRCELRTSDDQQSEVETVDR
jgi:hypothetical protein